MHLRGANLLNNPSTVHRWTPKSLHWQWQLDSVAMVAHGLTRSGRGFYRRGFFERSLSACPFRTRSRCQSSASADRRVGVAVTTIRGFRRRRYTWTNLIRVILGCIGPRGTHSALSRVLISTPAGDQNAVGVSFGQPGGLVGATKAAVRFRSQNLSETNLAENTIVALALLLLLLL